MTRRGRTAELGTVLTELLAERERPITGAHQVKAARSLRRPRTTALPPLDETALRLYSHALKNGMLREADLADLSGGHATAALRTAFAQLCELGLLKEHDGRLGTYLPVDPRLVEARLGGEWRATAGHLLEQAARLSELLPPFAREFRELAEGGGHDGDELVYLTDEDLIRAAVREAVEQSTDEVLTAQPVGPRPAGVLEEVHEHTIALLERKVDVRMLYQHAARHDPQMRSYFADLKAHGAQVRTLDHFCERLIVVDRSTAFLPADARHNTAMLIRSRPLVRFVAEVFEHNWNRAKVFDGTHNPKAAALVSDWLKETIVRCLIEGESDSAIAKRIGLSPRSYATHVAKLKATYDAQSRFQLGYRLGLAMAADRSNDDAAEGASRPSDSRHTAAT